VLLRFVRHVLRPSGKHRFDAVDGNRNPAKEKTAELEPVERLIEH
jgi:hypothetical protein